MKDNFELMHSYPDFPKDVIEVFRTLTIKYKLKPTVDGICSVNFDNQFCRLNFNMDRYDLQGLFYCKRGLIFKKIETEADKGGLDLLIQNRIDINGMTELFKRMEKIAEGKSVPAYLSTHPDSEDRLETIEEEIKDKQNNYVHSEKLDDLFQQLTTFTNSYD
ncbi:MAG: M48 family metalloprotease [Bacteroidota bacterium]